MAEHTVRQEEEAVSLSERPLQRAKQGGKTTCWKCFQDASVTNFFAKGAGMIQHFRTMHRNIDVDEVRCKTLFPATSRQGNSRCHRALKQISLRHA